MHEDKWMKLKKNMVIGIPRIGIVKYTNISLVHVYIKKNLKSYLI